MTQLELYATPRLVVKWWVKTLVGSSSSLFMHANYEPKAHQVATLYLKNDACQQKKPDFQKQRNKKENGKA